jgi:hypothetical protein
MQKLGVVRMARTDAIRILKEFMQVENDGQCLDDEIKTRKTDNEVKAEIEAMMNGEPIERLL